MASVKQLFTRKEIANSLLLIDETGVGKAVVQMFTTAKISATIRGITITGGERDGASSVCKKNLVGSVQSVLSSRRLKIAPGLPLAKELAEELENFRVKVTADRNETFSARDRTHDDLVLSLAMSLNAAERSSVVPPGSPGIHTPRGEGFDPRFRGPNGAAAEATQEALERARSTRR